MARNFKQNSKKDWKIVGNSVYFINIDEAGFPLYRGKIEKDNEDGTFLVNAICQRIDKPKNPIKMIVDGRRLRISFIF